MEQPPWSLLQEKFFETYYSSLPDDLLPLTVGAETILLINLTTKTLLLILKNHKDTFALFEKCVTDVRLKCYQACVVLEKMGSVPLASPITKPVTCNIDTLNYDINCTVDLMLCVDLLIEAVQNLSVLDDAIKNSKEYAMKLYQACSSVADEEECAVCGCRHTMSTECGHYFCYECFVKASSMKTECPVCRNVIKFRYKPRDTPDSLEIVRSYYKEQELTWCGK